MNPTATTNKDSRGRRKSSPSATVVYSRKIRNINDPDGLLEEEINKLARRLSRAKSSGSVAQQLSLKERLVTKCMRYFYVTGLNVSVRDDGVTHEGSYAQVDEIFIETLVGVIDGYDASKGVFTHMVRFIYSRKVDDAAYKAAREDTAFGGSDESAPISLDAQARKNDDDSTTVGDLISSHDDSGECESYAGDCWVEIDEREVVNAIDALEESGALSGAEAANCFDDKTEAIDDMILLKTISLITGFLEKSGRAANDTRKLYTRMFFSETLTRMTKVRTEGELEPLRRREKGLFGAVELPFQDSYTVMQCRTIVQLWESEFVDGVPKVGRPYRDESSSRDESPDYSWTLPGAVFVSYLASIGKPASDPLVSQQRSHYEKLLKALRP